MTGLQPYPEYRDSGVAWLGNIPSHWECAHGGAVLQQKKVSNRGMLESVVLSLSYGRIVVKPPEKLHGLVPESFETYQVVDPGDIIIRPTDLQNDWNTIRVGLAQDRGIITSAYICFRTREPLSAEFAHLLLLGYDLKKVFYGMGSGLRQNLDWSDFKRMPILLPPPDEQLAIVRFIRDMDRKINRFIRNRRRLIEVLNEQKQAIINRAVTRGLNPNAPLKPSGIDWLGDIPRHWEVKRLKFVAKIIYGSSPHNSTYNTDGIGTVLVNGPDEYSREDFGLTRSVKWTTAPVKFAPKGALLFCLRGSTTGRLNICHTDLSIGRGVAALIPRENQHYFSYAMMALRGHLKATFRGSTFPSVTSNHLNNYWLPQPPIIEQEYIAKYIDEATMALNQAIDRANREIDLIREYRTRLIADVVTGKVDVRQASVVVAEKKTKKPANIHFRRSVFAAEIVHRLHDEPTFGHVKFEKLIFLCEKRCGVETGSTYYRQAAGPYDNRALRSIDSQLKTQRWYEAHRGDKGTER